MRRVAVRRGGAIPWPRWTVREQRLQLMQVVGIDQSHVIDPMVLMLPVLFGHIGQGGCQHIVGFTGSRRNRCTNVREQDDAAWHRLT